MTAIQHITNKISFMSIDNDLFDETARQAAEIIAQNRNNKPTQLRRFYDEIVMWHDKLQGKDNAAYQQALPFIKMLNAKVNYARGRELIDQAYVDLLAHCLRKLDTQEVTSFFHFKLFMEAFMGFHKNLYEQKHNNKRRQYKHT